MADHVYKNKATGVETLLPESFAKTKHAAGFDDLGEGYLHRDPVSGNNSVKLKVQASAETKPEKPVKPAAPAKGKEAAKPKAEDKPADKPAEPAAPETQE